MGGGMEAVYLDMIDHPLGFLNFAPAEPARRAMFSARSRLKAGGEAKVAAPVNEEELYDRGWCCLVSDAVILNLPPPVTRISQKIPSRQSVNRSDPLIG
jgi:hypothetical protein